MSSTPMMRQYQELKSAHADATLLFRLGDFYEMFGEDAQRGAAILGLTLTKRQEVPMCGVPYHAARGYIARLLRAGIKVAVCEQISLQSDTPGLAERQVVEVLSPGTVFEDDYLESDRNNYLMAVAVSGSLFVAAWIDASTGEFMVAERPLVRGGEALDTLLQREIARLSPAELLLQESLTEQSSYARALYGERGTRIVSRYPDWSFDPAIGHRRLCELFGTENLQGFGFVPRDAVLGPVAVLLDYLEHNARHLLRHVRTIVRHEDERLVILDESTQRNLELIRNLNDGSKQFTLLSVLDHTLNPMGGRLLRRRICAPSRDLAEIERRTSRVEALYRNQPVLSHVRSVLRGAFDLERLIGRLGVDKAHPRDIRAIADTVAVALELHAHLTERLSVPLLDVRNDPSIERSARELADRIHATLVDEPPVIATEGGIVRDGVDPEIDRLRALESDGRAILEAYVEEERRRSNINTLRLRHNRVLGHFFEVSRAAAAKVPTHFVRRQSLANAERFGTDRLSELEQQIAGAGASAAEREQELFEQLRNHTAQRIGELHAVAAALAELDVTQSLAHAATRHGYTRATLVEEPIVRIEEGRHPVVEAARPAGEFVPNSIRLEQLTPRFALITGPNMAGKSTVLRQTALIVLMAHIGSFVPAAHAVVGQTDRIFCRVGASDNIARGESTFLVEMNETSLILRNATRASLVIMDEVGRGTGTRDGLSIAWAVSEYLLHKIGARTLFATHYHELARIEHPALLRLKMAVDHSGERIIFLKRLEEGAGDRSYGIDVALMAGIPREVINRARLLMEKLDTTHNVSPEQPELFDAPFEIAADAQPGRSVFDETELQILSELNALQPDELTPRRALELLYEWHARTTGR